MYYRATKSRGRDMERFQLWLQTSARAYSERTIESYTLQVELFARWLDANGIDPTKVTKEDLLDHYAEATARGASPGSISLRHAAIRRLFDYFLERGAITANPAKEIPFRTPKHRSGEPYTENEVKRMYLACRTWQERAIFMLLLGTGIRRSEVFRVARDDCNFDNGTIRVKRKGGKYQHIMPEAAVMEAVRMALEFNDRLCPQKWNGYIGRLVKALGNRANIPGRHHPHRLRFTFAVNWCEMGGQESELMEALGHSSLRMTMLYARVGRERRAMRTMQTIGIAHAMLGQGIIDEAATRERPAPVHQEVVSPNARSA